MVLSGRGLLVVTKATFTLMINTAAKERMLETSEIFELSSEKLSKY